MILQSLIDYYRRLEASEGATVAPYGFSSQGVHFAVVLNRDGTLFGDRLADLQEEVDSGRGKTRLVPRQMLLPDRGGRSGTLIKPNFLWDNTGYALGRDGKGKPERAEKMFEAFRELHLSLADEIADEDYAVVCRFIETWTPDRAESLVNWEEASGKNVVFQVRGHPRYVHQSEAVKTAWLRRVAEEEEAVPGYSLITGEWGDIARLHPPIKGVANAQTTGAAIVAFNLDAFESYGRSQSYNAPVGVREAFRYATALNHLLHEGRHRMRIGDATVVFWADRRTPFESILGPLISQQEEDPDTLARVRGFLEALRRGSEHGGLDDAEVGFHVLGPSPNASRLSVRFWLCGTVAQFVERLAAHHRELQLDGGKPDAPPLTVRRLLFETAREPKDISPQLAGELTRSILAGTDYPQSLFTAVLRRVRADRAMSHNRAALLKAFLVRNYRKEVPVSLNTNHPEPAYHLGRLFAALEKTQEDALGQRLNRTIRDSYFGTASAMPASVFPRLMRLHQHHLGRIENRGQQINREKLIQEICDHLDDGFPAHLSLTEQGLFHVAYYHQRQDFFTRSDDEDTDETRTDEQEA